MQEKRTTGESIALALKDTRAGLRYKVFSSYKPVLALHDVVMLFFSFVLTTMIAGLSLKNLGLANLILLAMMTISVFVATFFVMRLYSYGANFIWRSHLARLKRALAWVLFCFVVFVLLLNWKSLHIDKVVIPSLIAILGFCLLFVRHNSRFLTNLTYSLAICLSVYGAIGLFWTSGLSVLKIYSYLLPIFFVISAGLLMGGRYLLVHIVFNGWMRKIFRWKMVVVGSNAEAKHVTEYMVKNDAPFYVKGYITSDINGDSGRKQSKACLGNVYQLAEIAASIEIDDIVVTDETIDKKSLVWLLDFCMDRRLNVWFPPSLLPIINIKIQSDYLCGLPMIRMCTQKFSWMFNPVKHGLDALMALPLAILLLPVFLIIALAIKLTSEGSVFYKPDAIGRYGKIFRMYKFRSMFTDNSSDIHKIYVLQLIKGEIGEKGIDGQTLKITHDPRVTRVGKFLRRFSLDELPQLINVLKGEMSLVGPRPCLPYEYDHYEDWYKKRVSIRPGITGVWQVAGRSEVAFEDMILLDLYYVYNRGVLLDFQVLLATVGTVVGGKGAF